jgi:hypothetical protein
MVRRSAIRWTAALSFLRSRPLRTGVVAILPVTGGLRRHWSLARDTSGLPTALAVALATLTFFDGVNRNATVVTTLLVAASGIVAWNVWLIARARRRNHALTLQVVLRKQHYVQACAQGSVLVYWGWSWQPVYDFAPLIAGQLIFAYAFDMLLAWSRRSTYTLGFGPFPVIFSINLFLWFKPDWFYLQFLMVVVGFAAKELIRWSRDGRIVHIFNPSSFPLGLFSLVLILTGTSDVTRGQDIAISQFYPAHMYLLIFLVGLPGQFLFGVASMTLSAVLTTYFFGLAYFGATGTYFFYDSYVPISVFLGMHLLFTDPSTAPRTELGRVVFGVLYGSSAVALYQLLGAAGVPTFYDKLLQVPILNLSVKLLDRMARAQWFEAFDPSRVGRSLTTRQRHLAYMSVWAVAFAAMSATQGVGDHHPGQWLPFWERACRDGRPRACAYLANMESIFCNAGSGWACNEAVILQDERATAAGGASRWDPPTLTASFQRGCMLGFVPACRNVVRLENGTRPFERSLPTLADYRILLRGSKGPVTDRAPSAMNARACEQGWPADCSQTTRAGPD